MALTVRTDDELERALTVLAEAESLSRQEIIRRAVLERYERANHHRRVERLAWLATAVFLDLSDATPTLDDDAAFNLVMQAAAGHLDVEQIAADLRKRP